MKVQLLLQSCTALSAKDLPLISCMLDAENAENLHRNTAEEHRHTLLIRLPLPSAQSNYSCALNTECWEDDEWSIMEFTECVCEGLPLIPGVLWFQPLQCMIRYFCKNPSGLYDGSKQCSWWTTLCQPRLAGLSALFSVCNQLRVATFRRLSGKKSHFYCHYCFFSFFGLIWGVPQELLPVSQVRKTKISLFPTNFLYGGPEGFFLFQSWGSKKKNVPWCTG